MKKLVYRAGAVCALAACLSAPSCIGPNNAYNSLATWNSKLSDSKFLNELAYLGLNIIPVYGLFLFADCLVFNSVEFWSGKNWIDKPEPFKPQETPSGGGAGK